MNFVCTLLSKHQNNLLNNNTKSKSVIAYHLQEADTLNKSWLCFRQG